MTQERETALVARGVTAGEKNAEKISFSFGRKGIHGILGPAGAGKGALLRRLAGIARGEGEITLLGERVAPEATAVRARIGFVPECPVLDGEMTAMETLEFAGSAKGVAAEKKARQIEEAVVLLGLKDVRKRLVSRLGEGERWRLALGVALLGAPELLIFENPTAGAEGEEKRERTELLRMLGKVKTVVLSTSRFAVARELCEDVVLLSDGALLATGSFEELEETLASNGGESSLEEIYRQLCGRSRTEEVAE